MSEKPSVSRLAPVRQVDVLRLTEAGSSRGRDLAAVEEPLEIRLHDRPFVVIMRTPGSDRELAAGFLFAEGVVRSADDLGAVEHCKHPDLPDVHNVVNVFLLGEAVGRLETLLAERRNVVANSSCGICGRVTIESLETRAERLPATCHLELDVALSLTGSLRAEQPLFDQTGGLHGAALATSAGTMITVAEDVGRHNAVDKVIGRLLLEERLPLPGAVLVVSGRTSFEIVQKAWLAGIEIISAVSAPSSLAIELADTAGITLLGFSRGHGFNVYTHPQRIRSSVSACPP